MPTVSGSHATSLSTTSAEHLLASNLISKLGASAGSATLHGSTWQNSGAESVMSGIGTATLIGARGISSIAGGSGQAAGIEKLTDRGAFSFDTVAVGGQHLLSNFVSGPHSIASSAAVGGQQQQHHGGQTQIALDHGKTVIHIKHHH